LITPRSNPIIPILRNPAGYHFGGSASTQHEENAFENFGREPLIRTCLYRRAALAVADINHHGSEYVSSFFQRQKSAIFLQGSGADFTAGQPVLDQRQYV